MVSYGWEQHINASTPARRLAHRLLGTYDVGARVRSTAVSDALRSVAEPTSILDAGCGRGQLCFQLHRRWPNAEICGVDVESGLITHCRELAAHVDGTRKLQFERRTLPDHLGRTFDLVVCVDVLEHIEDDEAFARCLADATAPSGTLALHTPATPQKRYLSEYEEQHDHVRDGYGLEELRALVLRAGYNCVEVGYTFGFYGALAWEVFALAKRGNVLARGFLPLAYPIAAIDGLKRPRRGNGLLAVAQKR
jgi:SAM-dependent methyltransferase